MSAKNPKGIKIDPSRLHLNTTKAEPKTSSPQKPRDKK